MDAFYALAEPRRRRIIEIVAASGQLSATEIANRFDITAQAVSQHLGVLLQTDLLKVHKRAQQRIYEINPDKVLEVEAWTEKTLRTWNGRLDRLDRVLQDEKKANAKK